MSLYCYIALLMPRNKDNKMTRYAFGEYRAGQMQGQQFIAKLHEAEAYWNPGIKCRRGGSNPYTFRYRILSPARLPIPPLLRAAYAIRTGVGLMSIPGVGNLSQAI